MERVKLIECPRDAWQGLPEFIPTEVKTEYLKELLLAGFKHIDAVSFVSPKHVKQMADSEEVMAKLSASLPHATEADRRQGAGAGDSRRHHHRISVFHFGVFSTGECQHDSRGITGAGRDAEETNGSGESRLGHLHLHGLRQSLRRTVGIRDCAGHAGVAEGCSRSHRLAGRHGRYRLAGTGR